MKHADTPSSTGVVSARAPALPQGSGCHAGPAGLSSLQCVHFLCLSEVSRVVCHDCLLSVAVSVQHLRAVGLVGRMSVGRLLAVVQRIREAQPAEESGSGPGPCCSPTVQPLPLVFIGC